MRNYKALPGVNAVGVSEFGWGVTSESNNSFFKCVQSEGGQRTMFEQTVKRVRNAGVGVHNLVWFNLVDGGQKDRVRCKDKVWYNVNAAYDHVNTNGIYRRDPDGELANFTTATRARLIRNCFRLAQQPPPFNCGQ